MVDVKPFSSLLSMEAHGVFGWYKKNRRSSLPLPPRGSGLGGAGIYQRYRYGKKTVLKLTPFHVPTNPRTAPQQAWRAIFRSGHLAWQALSDDTKKRYNKDAQKYRMSGYNLYMRRYLNSHK